MSGFIYFIQAEQSKRVKIGYSAKPQKRLKNLQCGFPEKLSIIKQFEGDRIHEQALHLKLDHLKVHGEWFEYEDDLRVLLLKKPSEIKTEASEVLDSQGVFALASRFGEPTAQYDFWIAEHWLHLYEKFPVAISKVSLWEKIGDHSSNEYLRIAKQLIPFEVARDWFWFLQSDPEIPEDMEFLRDGDKKWPYEMILAIRYPTSSFFRRLFLSGVPDSEGLYNRAWGNAIKIFCLASVAWEIDDDCD